MPVKTRVGAEEAAKMIAMFNAAGQIFSGTPTVSEGTGLKGG
jgi:hypothetical protein